LALIADHVGEVGDIVEDLLVAAQANIGKGRSRPSRPIWDRPSVPSPSGSVAMSIR
jgi:hypothetical protein